MWAKWIESRTKKRKKSKTKSSLKESSKDDSVENRESIKSIRRIVTLVGTLAAMLFLIFGASWFFERIRTNYKIIVDDKVMIENEMVVLTPENKGGMIYVVVHEDEDEYIVTRLIEIENRKVIDYDYLKSVSKENIVTYYVRDIYDIK